MLFFPTIAFVLGQTIWFFIYFFNLIFWLFLKKIILVFYVLKKIKIIPLSLDKLKVVNERKTLVTTNRYKLYVFFFLHLLPFSSSSLVFHHPKPINSLKPPPFFSKPPITGKLVVIWTGSHILKWRKKKKRVSD